MKFVSWCIIVDIYQSITKCFRITVVSCRLLLVSFAFLAETDLSLRLLQITIDGSICCFITTFPLLPPLWLHWCTYPSQIYYYYLYFLIVLDFAVFCYFSCTGDLLLLADLILDNFDNTFNHYDWFYHGTVIRLSNRLFNISDYSPQSHDRSHNTVYIP